MLLMRNAVHHVHEKFNHAFTMWIWFFPENIPSRKPHRFKRYSILYFLHVFNCLASIHMWLYTYHVLPESRHWGRCIRHRHSGIRLLSPLQEQEHSGTGLDSLIPVPSCMVPGSAFFFISVLLTGYGTVRYSGIYKNSAKVERLTPCASILLVVKRHPA